MLVALLLLSNGHCILAQDAYIAETGAWQTDVITSHCFSPCLAEAIVMLLKRLGPSYSSVVDLGCGHGIYSEVLVSNGFQVACFDGNYQTAKHTKGLCQTKDLADLEWQSKEPRILPADVALALEVGEHLPVHFEQRFLTNLAIVARRAVILSWAVPDQEGDGHVNLRENEYVVAQMEVRGFQYENITSRYLRRVRCDCVSLGNDCGRCEWFDHTLMVFQRN